MTGGVGEEERGRPTGHRRSSARRGASGRFVRNVWAACLLLAGLNHARILLRHGLFWDYGGVARASAVYWSSLTIVDPLAATLLLTRPRAGVPLTAIVIATDVVHNLAVTAHYMPEGQFLTQVTSSASILGQIAFLLFVTATWRIAWKDVPAPRVRADDRAG